jgi:hypothetical protein
MELVLIALHRSLGFPGMVPKTLLSTVLNIRAQLVHSDTESYLKRTNPQAKYRE